MTTIHSSQDTEDTGREELTEIALHCPARLCCPTTTTTIRGEVRLSSLLPLLIRLYLLLDDQEKAVLLLGGICLAAGRAARSLARPPAEVSKADGQ